LQSNGNEEWYYVQEKVNNVGKRIFEAYGAKVEVERDKGAI
jgi:hypothetical protein